VTVNTIFHHTHLPLQKWFLAVALTLNAKKGLSARQLARDLKINKDTAWRIAMKIRDAMADSGHRELLTGIVEADEVYLGWKPRKQHPHDKHPRGRGTKKTPVLGMIERSGKVKAQVISKKDLASYRISTLVRRNVDIKNAVLFTDEYSGYIGIKRFMEHRTVNHQVWYVGRDGTHTNNIESFWALLKRGLIRQYHKVSLRHLPKYINEFSYRFNHRETEDLFGLTLARAVGVA
jgi:transposase-like protein